MFGDLPQVREYLKIFSSKSTAKDSESINYIMYVDDFGQFTFGLEVTAENLLGLF